jgi:Protein of unknown function (DUF4199)
MKPYVKYGLIAAGISIAWSLIGYLLGNETQESLKWVSNIVIITVSVLCFRGAIAEVRTAQNGFISFRQAFKVSFLTGLIAAVINLAFTYVYFTYINPEFIGFIIEKAQQDMIDKGMSDEQVEMAIKMQSKFMTPAIMAGFALLFSLVFNAIIGLIMAAIMKKENPDDVFEGS